MKNIKSKIDIMLLATFLSTIFYTCSYPYVHKIIMANVSDSIIALNQIINCLSIIMIGSLWNKTEKIFKYFPMFCIVETLLVISTTIWVIVTRNILAYYIIDTLVFSIVTRNIFCGYVKLKAIKYSSEEREKFDNNNNSASAIATIIGSIIAMMIELDFAAMLCIAVVGNTIDNVFYLYIYKNIQIKNTDEDCIK